MSNDLDARIKVGADTREAEAGIDRVNDKVSTMGETASKAGAKASTALDGMGKSSEAAATKFTRSESAMGVALRRTVEQMEIAVRQGKSLADAFQIKAEIRGFDASKFDPMLERMRQLESQLAVVKAAEEDFAAQNAFAKKHQQATELNRAGEYTSWWAAELKKVEEAERELAAQNAFAKKHQQAADLTKASQYTDWWEAELKKAEAAETELGAQNAFAKKHQQATELAKASQYASWWAAELEKVDAAERKLAAENAFVSSLKSQSDAIGKTRADLLELQAAQMGVASQAAPFIAKLREAETGMSGAGMSARAMSAAMRGVPAQISDIVVSLQGGMPIMTVFMQQGFQLRDMFGGFGPAGKALAATLVSLVNPYTVAAAAVVALGAAMYYTEDKLRTNMALMAQLEATGRAGYLNSEAIKQLKKDMADLPGISKSMASAIIADLVQVRTLGGEALQKIALLSADFAAATGQDAAGAAKELAKAMEDPVKGAQALDEAFNFLTVSQRLAIEAMVEAGDKAGAQEVVLDALSNRVKDLAEKKLTPLQEATKNFGGAWSDAMGRLNDKGALNFANSALAGLIIKTGDLITALSNIEIPASLKWLANLHPALKLASMAADSLAATGAAAANKLGSSGGATGGWGEGAGGVTGTWGAPSATGVKSDADKELADLLDATKAFKGKKDAVEDLNKTLTRLQAQQKRLRDESRGDSKEADELQARINGVTEKIKSLGKTRDDGSKKERSTYAELAASIQAKIDVNKQELEFSGKLNEAQKAEIKLNSDLKEGKIKLSEAHEKDLRKRIEEWKQQEQAQEKAKQNVAMYQQQLDIGKELTEDYVKRSNALASARQAMDAYEKAAQEEHERLQLEAGLIGMSNQARAVALAQYDAELELTRKIAEINSLDATQPKKEELRNRARVVAAQKMVSDQTRVHLNEWEKAYEQTSQALTDALMRGGKNGGELLRDYFRTLTLRPIIKAVADPIAAPITSGIQAMLGQGSGSSNALGTANSVQSMWSSFSGGLTGSLGSAIAGLGAQLGSTAATAFGSGIVTGGQMGLFGGALGHGAAVMGSGVAGGTAAGLGTMAGAALPWVAGAAALLSIIKGFDDSGTPHSGAGAVYSKATGVQSGAGIYNQSTFGMGHHDEYSEAMQAGISGIAQGLGQTLDSFAVSFGKTAGYSVATAFADDSSKDGSWGSLKIADELGKVLVNWEDSRASKWAPKTFADGEEGFKQYQNEIFLSVRGEIEKMDIAGWGRQILKTATDIDTLNTALQQIATVKTVFDGLGKTMGMFADLSGDLQTRLLAASGGIDALASNAEVFYQGFYTEGERALKQRELQMAALARMGLYIDPAEGDAAAAAFKKTVVDAMESGQVEFAAQLMAMSGTFKQTTDLAQQFADATAQAAKSLRESLISLEGQFAGGGLSRQYRAEDAAGQMQKLLSSAGVQMEVGTLASVMMSATSAEVEHYFREIWKVLPTDAAKAELVGLASTMMDLAAATDAARESAAQAAAQSMSGAWSNFGTMAGLAAQYTGNTAGLSQQLGVVQGSYANATTTDGRVAALQQIINLEQGLWNGQQAARQAEAAAATARASAAREQINAAKQLLSAAQGLGNYAKSLGFSEASGLGDKERLAALDAQRQGLLAKVNTGDVGAMQELQGITNSYLALEQQMAVSQQDYSVLSGRIAAELAATAAIQEASASSQVSQYERQIAAAESVAASSAGQFTVSAATQKLIDELLVESATAFETEATLAQKLVDQGVMTTAALQSLPAELAGAIGASLIPAIAGLASAMSSAAGISVPQFAEGGFHVGGLRIVGERGPELEATGPSRVWNQAQLAGALGGNNNAALVAAVDRLTAQNARMAAELAEIKASTAKFADQFDQVTAGGNAMATEAFA